MYERFQAQFPAAGPREGDFPPPRSSDLASVQEFQSHFSGTSFRQGLYRVVNATTLRLAESFIDEAFPKWSGVPVFGYDWLGRVFALDPARSEAGGPGVLLLEPGTAEALEVPTSLRDFHETELIDEADAAVAASFHGKWLAAGGSAPKLFQCVGYRRPLFLGGADDLTNIEMSDLDVYWTLTAQLIAKTRGLPAGTKIRVQRA
jgi:hypothetical protein